MSDQDINIRVLGDVAPFQAAMGDAAAAVQQVQGAAAGAAGGGGLNDLTEQLQGAADAASDTGDALQDAAQDVIASGGSWRSLATLVTAGTAAMGGLVGIATVLGPALYEASQESVALANSLTLTGNQAGLTTDQLVTMSRSVADAAGATRSAGTAAMAEVVSAGGIAAGQMEMVTAAALRLEDVGAQSVKDTVREFAELGREPVAASLALTEKLGYLTAETYEQIAALEEQGRTSEAAALAQQAYGAALDEVADGMEENLGWVETAWNTLGSAAALAWDKILNIGREDTLAEQLAEAKRQMAEGVSFFERTAGFLTGETVDPAMAVKVIEAQIEAEEKAAKAKAEKNQQEAAHIGWLQDGERYLTKNQQMETEIAKARNQGLAAKRTEAEIEERIGQIRAKYAPKSGSGSGGSSAAALAREAAAAEREHLKALREREKAELAAIDMAERGLESLQAQVERMRESNAEIGLSGLALLDLKVARLEDAAATNEQAAAAAELLGRTPAEIQAYRDKAAALRELATLTREGGLAKEAEANDAARAKAATQAAREAEDAWRQSAQQIEQSITDALLRGFEGGKGIAETFRDTLENMFKTLVLRPVVSALVQPVANGIAGMVSGGGGGGAGSSLGMAGDIYSLASNAGSLLGLTGAGAAAGTVGMANMVGMVGGDALGTLIAGNSVGWGTSAAGIAGGGAMGAIGAALPWIGGALAVASLLGAFDKKPSNKAAGGDVDLATGSMSGLWNMTGKKQASQQTMDGRTAFLQAIGAFGAASGATGSVGIDIGERDGVQASFGGGPLEKFGHDADAALMGIIDRVVESATVDPKMVAQWQVLKTSLDGSTKSAADMVDVMRLLAADVSMVDIERANLIQADGEGLAQSYGRVAALMGINQTAAEQFALAQQLVADEFDALGLAVPQSAAAFRELLSGIDLTTDEGRELFQALADIGPAFLDVASAIEQARAAIADTSNAAREQLQMSVMDDAQKYAYYDGRIDATLAELATASDPAAIMALVDSAVADTLAAYNLLSPAEQARLNGDFVARIDAIEAQGEARLSVAPLPEGPSDEALGDGADAATQMATVVGAAVERAMQAAAERMQAASADQADAADSLGRAVASIPGRIVIENRVSVSVPETGYA